MDRGPWHSPVAIASELFQFKKGSPDRGKMWESSQESLNKLDNEKFTIKEKRGVRDRWNVLQAEFKRIQQENVQASSIDCELSEKDAFIEELREREDSYSAKDKKKSDDKEAPEEIRKKAMESMVSKKKKTHMNPPEATPKRSEEAGEKRSNSWKKKLKVSIPFANRI